MHLDRRLHSAAPTVVAAIGCALPLSCHSLPPPSFAYVDSNACHDVVAYSWTQSLQEEIRVDVDLDKIKVELGQTRIVDIASDGVDVQIERAGKLGFVGCSDVGREPTPPRHIWRGVSGTLTVRPFPLPQQPVEGATDVLYGIEITINALRVQGPNGQQAAASKAIVLTGKGGWGPG